MHPEPELRIAADVHLQYVGAALRELANRIRSAGLRSRDWTVIDQTVAAARKRKREDRDHGRAGAQRQCRERRRRRSRAIEELDRYRVRMQMLIDQHRDAAIALQIAQHSPEATLPIDDRIAGARANALEHRVQIRIVERPCHDRDRLGVQRKSDRLNFPVAEMTGEVQHTLALAIGLAHMLLPLDLNALEHLLVWKH